MLETYVVVLQDMHDVPNITTAFSVAIAVIKNHWIDECAIFLYSQID